MIYLYALLPLALGQLLVVLEKDEKNPLHTEAVGRVLIGVGIGMMIGGVLG